MTLPTSLTFGASALKLSEGASERLQGGGRKLRRFDSWQSLVALASPSLACALSRRRGVAAEAAVESDALDEAELWDPPGPEVVKSPPPEWLFWGFLLCMAVAALPFVGIRWTTPQATLSGAFEDAMVLALPVALPLPLLFLGCAAALVFRPASRTPAALVTFGLGIALGLAAVHALLG